MRCNHRLFDQLATTHWMGPSCVFPTDRDFIRAKMRNDPILAAWNPPSPEDRCLIAPQTFATMREQGGRWAAYQCAEIGTHDYCGQLFFLKFGPGCTFARVADLPERYPGPSVIHAMSFLVGEVDFSDETGNTICDEIQEDST